MSPQRILRRHAQAVQLVRNFNAAFFYNCFSQKPRHPVKLTALVFSEHNDAPAAVRVVDDPDPEALFARHSDAVKQRFDLLAAAVLFIKLYADFSRRFRLQ